MAYFKGIGTPSEEEILIEAIMGRSMNGTYEGAAALKNSDIRAGVSIVAGDLASFPIIKRDNNGTVQEMGDMSYILNTQATSNAGARSWKFTMIAQSILSGNSYSIIKKDNDGNVWELDYYSPSEVTVEIDEKTRELTYKFKRDGQQEIVKEAKDVFHLKLFTSDTLMGSSPLSSLKDDIAMQEAGRDTLSKFFRTGTSSGILKVNQGKLNKEAKKKVRKEFEDIQNGGGHSAIVLDSTMDYQQLQVDTNILQLINSNNYTTSQIAKCLRIPAYKLAVNSPNQSVDQLNRDYVNNDLTYYMDAFLEEANLKLMTFNERIKYQYDFNTSRLTDVDQETKIANVTKKIKDGVITVNEGRMELGYEKLDNPDCDKLVVSLNYTFLDSLMDLKGGGKDEENGNQSNIE